MHTTRAPLAGRPGQEEEVVEVSEDVVEAFVREWAAVVADMQDTAAGATEPGDERLASEAAAVLWSGYGRLDAPPGMARLITEAIEVGYLTAVRDMRDGRVEL